jgi:hypothetical protein
MRDQITRYTAKLLADRSATPGTIAIAVQDDQLFAIGNEYTASLAEQILAKLNALALVVTCLFGGHPRLIGRSCPMTQKTGPFSTTFPS